MGQREKPNFPDPQDHSLRIYSAFLGQKPTVAPDGKSIIHPPTSFWQRACSRAVAIRNRLRDRKLGEPNVSPAVRARLAPLLAHARMRWREACERVMARVETPAAPAARPKSNGNGALPGRFSASGNGHHKPAGRVKSMS